MDERVPGREREAVRPREERIDVEAVQPDDHDRDDEERDNPRDREAQQPRGRYVPFQAALTSSHILAYSARRGMSRSRYAFGSPTAFGLEIWRTRARSAEDGRARVFEWP